MATLSSMTLRLAKTITDVRESVATGGSATTLEDSELSGIADYSKGTIWILSGTHIAKSREILENPQDKFEFATLGSALAGDESYAVADQRIRRDLLMSAVNEGLRKVKKRTTEDDSSLTVDAEVDTYTLPAGVSDLTKVEVARNTSTPYGYDEVFHWEEIGGELRFGYDYRPKETGNKIRLTYKGAHVDVTDESTSLGITNLDEEAVFWRALIEVVRPLRKLRPKDKALADLFTEAQTEWQRRVPEEDQRPPIYAEW